MSITLVIVIINVVVSMMGFNNPSLLYKLTMSPYAILRKGEYWRLVTSGFIHSNWMHLGFNMFTFFFFGQSVEAIFKFYGGGNSTLHFVFFYLLAIVLSDIPSLLKHREDMHYNALGASGGVTAVVFMSILFSPLTKICLYGFLCLPGFIFGALYIIYSINQGRQMSDNVNHSAHLSGAIVGIFYSLFLNPGVLGEFFQQIASFKLF